LEKKSKLGLMPAILPFGAEQALKLFRNFDLLGQALSYPACGQDYTPGVLDSRSHCFQVFMYLFVKSSFGRLACPWKTRIQMRHIHIDPIMGNLLPNAHAVEQVLVCMSMMLFFSKNSGVALSEAAFEPIASN